MVKRSFTSAFTKSATVVNTNQDYGVFYKSASAAPVAPVAASSSPHPERAAQISRPPAAAAAAASHSAPYASAFVPASAAAAPVVSAGAAAFLEQMMPASAEAAADPSVSGAKRKSRWG